MSNPYCEYSHEARQLEWRRDCFIPAFYSSKGQIQEKRVSLLRFIVNPKDSIKPEARKPEESPCI